MPISKTVLIVGIVVGGVVIATIIGVVCYFVFSSGPTQFEKECLASHNHYRSLHGSPDMELNSIITQYAQEWADELSDSDSMEHRVQHDYGESIFSAGGDEVIPCETAVSGWYSESKSYNYDDPQFGVASGHFTQVVWKATKELGCGYAEKNNKVVIVCNYLPPGNAEGGFADNVPKAL